MSGIYYLLSIVAVFVVFVWYIRNEGSAESTRGLLAMKQSNPAAPEAQAKKRWQHKPKV